jgi:hypothetical protein
MTIDYFFHFNRLYILSQITTTDKIEFYSTLSKNTDWGLLGVIVTSIGVLAAILIAVFQSQRKDFSYYITSAESIFSISDDIKNRMAITFDNKPIKSLNLIVIKFKNTGKAPIQPSDYERHIWIKFGDSSEILSVDVVNKEPNNVNVIAKNSPLNQTTPQLNPLSSCDVISVNPLLLNSGDQKR